MQRLTTADIDEHFISAVERSIPAGVMSFSDTSRILKTPAFNHHRGLQEGLLGVPDIPNDSAGLMPSLLPKLRANSIAAGQGCAGLVDVVGHVYKWGELHLERSGRLSAPGRVASLHGIDTQKLCMGVHHFAALSDYRQTFVSGAVRPEQREVCAGAALKNAAAL